MKTIHALVIGVCVLGTSLGCGSAPEDQPSTIAQAVTQAVPSALNFRHVNVPAIETLNGVAFGNGKFVAVGKNASLEISSDGSQWTNVAAAFTGDISSIVFNTKTKTFQIIVSDSASTQHVYGSSDGKKWLALSSLALAGHATLSLANDKFFASGNDATSGAGTLYVSADAKTWTRSPTSLADSVFDEVVFGVGRYVAHASDEDGNSAVWVSTDALTWQSTHGLGQGGKAIVFGGGKFLAARDRRIEASSDGINWTISLDTEEASFSTLLFAGGFRAFDSNGAIWVSSDGVSWSQSAPPADVSIFDVAISGNTYVGVGAAGSLATTSNLSSWTVIDPPGGVSYRTIAFGSGKFVMADRGRVQTSTDGVNWKTTVPLTSERSYRSIKRVQNSFFAIYECGGGDRCIADSSDGINWLHSYSFSEEKPADVAFGNGKYVLVQGQGFITNFTSFCCTSTFNVDVFQLPSLESFVAVAFGAGKFVAVTPSGQIASSADGTNWDVHSSSGLTDVRSLTFGNGAFVAATATGVFSSQNGTTFVRVFSPPAGALNSQVGFANQLFFYTGDDGFIASSVDASAWSVIPSNTTDTVYQVAFGNALYVAGGDHNTVLTSK